MSEQSQPKLIDGFTIVAVVLTALSFVAYAIKFTNINSLPAHPLLVHIPVVLLPLAAIATVPLVWYGPWRKFLPVNILVAIVAFCFSVLAVNAGEAFRRTKNGPLVAEHAEYGDKVPIHALLLVISLILIRIAIAYGRRWIILVLAVFATLAAGFGFWTVYEAGDSGAKSVWQGQSVGGGGDDFGPPGSNNDNS